MQSLVPALREITISAGAPGSTGSELSLSLICTHIPHIHPPFASWRIHPPCPLRKHWEDVFHSRPEAIMTSQPSKPLSKLPVSQPPTLSFHSNLTGKAGRGVGEKGLHEAKWRRIVSRFPTELGDHEGQGCTARGVSWSLRRFWEAYLQTPDTLKKRMCRQVSKQARSRVGSHSRPRWSQGAFPSGLITTTHDPGQLQASSARYLRGPNHPQKLPYSHLPHPGSAEAVSSDHKWTN